MGGGGDTNSKQFTIHYTVYYTLYTVYQSSKLIAAKSDDRGLVC